MKVQVSSKRARHAQLDREPQVSGSHQVRVTIFFNKDTFLTPIIKLAFIISFVLLSLSKLI
jgi:hypothetical protein